MAIFRNFNILQCACIEKTALFYQQIFQFVVVKKREEAGVLQWMHLMHGEISLMLQQKNHQQTHVADVAVSPNIDMYFFVDNIKELHHFIKINYKIVSDLKLSEYQIYEFKLQDTEGNCIIVGQKNSLVSS